MFCGSHSRARNNGNGLKRGNCVIYRDMLPNAMAEKAKRNAPLAVLPFAGAIGPNVPSDARTNE